MNRRRTLWRLIATDPRCADDSPQSAEEHLLADHQSWLAENPTILSNRSGGLASATASFSVYSISFVAKNLSATRHPVQDDVPLNDGQLSSFALGKHRVQLVLRIVQIALYRSHQPPAFGDFQSLMDCAEPAFCGLAVGFNLPVPRQWQLVPYGIPSRQTTPSHRKVGDPAHMELFAPLQSLVVPDQVLGPLIRSLGH